LRSLRLSKQQLKNPKMKRIEKLFKSKNNILNIYVTSGYPKLNDTISIVQELAKNGVDMIEIGMPFSDPLADGPTIQQSSKIAIDNGITLDLIFNQIIEIRKTVTIPIIMMGYYNQVLKYGATKFFKKAKKVGVDGFILPDLPLDEYQNNYKKLLADLELDMIFLITPQTTDKRIKLIDNETSGFLYVVSSFAITGATNDIQQNQLNYFNRINRLSLTNSKLIGFGISNKKTFYTACQNANGAIIGSAFIKAIAKSTDLSKTIKKFVGSIL
jgi:tryptophan synthase alpha chain